LSSWELENGITIAKEGEQSFIDAINERSDLKRKKIKTFDEEQKTMKINRLGNLRNSTGEFKQHTAPWKNAIDRLGGIMPVDKSTGKT